MAVFCRILIFLVCFTTFSFAEDVDEKRMGSFKKPAHVSQETWNEVQPYLLPFDHPIKKKLDNLFTATRVTDNPSSITRAGFSNSSPAAFSGAIIAKNDRISGYYFKFYHDHQQIDIESKQWIDRAFEARSLQKAINDHGFQKFFVVPEKWIYPIPDYPHSTGPYPKNFILIAKKISIVRGNVNRLKWKMDVTRKLLNAVYIINQQEGLVDSCVGHNLTFTKDDKLAYIDLEQHHKWPVPFHRLNNYLNPDMLEYWTRLIQNNGP